MSQDRTNASGGLYLVGLVVVLMVMVCGIVAKAQTSLGTSSVAGTVRDTSGGAIASAKVTLLDRQHGTSRDTTSNGQGEYQFLAVLPGIYAVRVQQTGFRTTTVDNVQVIIDQAASVDATLPVGNVDQVVEVNSEGLTPLLDTQSNELGGVIDNKRVEELPLNGRNYLQLALLTGGTVPGPTGYSNQTGHGSTVMLDIAGASQWLSGFKLDGVSTRSPRLGNSSFNISVSAIDQFKIEYGFFLPDEGPQAGIVDVITKQGTNKFHGEAYEFLRTTSFNARSYFNVAPQRPDDLHRNQFGFSIGGPASIPHLWNAKNKLWFFGNYEGTRQIHRALSTLTVPSQAMFNGDFSALSTPIYNPYSYNPGTNTRAAFTNNQIPSGMINPISKSLLGYYLPQGGAGCQANSVCGHPLTTTNDDQFTVRVDSQLTPRQSLFVNFSYENSPIDQQSLLPLNGTLFPLKAAVAAAQHTISIGPHIVNILRIGYDRALTFDEGEGADGPLIQQQIGITGAFDQHGIPNVGMTGYAGFGSGFSRVGEISNSYEINDAFSYIRGTHNLAVGAGVDYHRTLQQNANSAARGSMSFQPVYTTEKPGQAKNSAGVTSGNAFADFLLGLPLSGSVSGLQPIHYYFTDVYPYFQDSWRVKPNFTVNYGAAWYLSTIPNPQGADAQLSHSFDFTTGLLTYAALHQISPQIIANDYNNFMPRLGFVWAPGRLKNTSVRAGFGMYYAQMGLNDWGAAASAPPFTTPVAFTNSNTANLPAISLGNGLFPVVPLPPLSESFAANLPNNVFNLTVMNPHGRTPYVEQWYMAVQHTFGKNDLLEADYIGNAGHKGSNRYSVDQCPVQPNLSCNNALRPYPKYVGISYYTYDANTMFEGVVVRYQHQMSRGLSILANYTLERSLSNGFDPNSSSATSNQITSCHRCDLGPTAEDVPQSLVVSALYSLPFGHGNALGGSAPAALNFLIGGWSMTAIGTFNHGEPVEVTSPNQTGSSGIQARPNRLCNGNDPSFKNNMRTNGFKEFNAACFAVPATGFFGNAGRGLIYAPGQDQIDYSIVKSFPIYERTRLELRGEFFNLFNHAQFLNPDTNAGDITTGKFSTVTSARDGRIVQLAGRIIF
ncbi:MAG TPA: carboxypeptidase-like regulatory domain-containing protein [Bryocella sp.]|nr:carboxypeptidase-like regulatory domain-containing protein [Bryocella sp.]